MAKTISRADKAIEDYTIETFHPEDKVFWKSASAPVQLLAPLSGQSNELSLLSMC